MSETKWKWNLYTDDSWKSLLNDFKKAKKSIDFENYLFFDDTVGRKFLEAFVAKAKEGVKVRVLIDAIGGRSLAFSPMVEEMEKAGVEFRFFNPFRLKWVYKYTWWFLRDHRKVTIIDGKIGYTGSVGMASFLSTQRDTYVRLEGEIVELIQKSFERMWLMTGRRKKFFHFAAPRNNNGDFSFYTNAPYPRQRFIYHKLLKNIRKAERHIYLTSPYFVPTTRFFSRLIKQAKRGVDIRLLLPKSTDHPIVDIARHSYIERALKSGIRIFHDDAKVFLHTKIVAIDDQWATVGSSNLDNLSFLLHYEANLVSTNKQFVSEIKNQFLVDCEKAKELTLKNWRKRSLAIRIIEKLTWPFHPLM